MSSSKPQKTPAQPLTLRECMQQAMQRYLSHLEGVAVKNIYSMVLTEVETPMLEAVLVYTHGNQSKAAEMLGMSRGTLRKKLKEYGLDE